MIKVSDESYELEILKENFVKSIIKKPFIEPDYAIFDVYLRALETGFEAYLEVEIEGNENLFNNSKILIKKILSRDRKRTIYIDYRFNLDKWERLNYIINKELGRKDLNFFYLLEEAIRKYQESLLKFDEQAGKKFLYEPFILHGSPVILCSPMGTGKTLFAIWLAFRIQNGIPLVENEEKVYNYEYYKSKVLYLAFEGNKEEIDEKIKAIRNYYEQNEKVFLDQKIEDFVLLFVPYTFYEPIVRKEIRKAISVYQPDLIIFDSITSALMSKNELKQAEHIFTYIKNVLEPRGIAALLIMHPSKQDLKEETPLPKGSILYMTYPRIVWYLKQTGEISDGFELKLQSIKDNLGLKKNSYQFEVHFEEDLCSFRLTKVVDESKQERKTIDCCFEYLQIHKKAKINDIAEYYKLNYEVIKKALQRLINKGLVVRLTRGLFALKTEEEEEEESKEKEPTVIEGNTDEIPF